MKHAILQASLLISNVLHVQVEGPPKVFITWRLRKSVRVRDARIDCSRVQAHEEGHALLSADMARVLEAMAAIDGMGKASGLSMGSSRHVRDC